MMAKIEWYQEVLALEPGSKVFFPYAKCLAEAGQHEDALRILRHGLALHPEFLEARVFLVALLQESGECAACATEMGPVLRLFAAFPAFWEAWSHVAQREGRLPEALGTAFLASAFRGSGHSLEELLVQALRQNVPGGPCTGALPAVPVEPVEPVDSGDVAESVEPSTPAAMTMLKPEEAPSAKASQSALMQAVPQDSVAPALTTFVPEDETDEALTLRTRSMADVLAEQGDVREALAIYRELAVMEKNPDERKSLNKRVKQLEKMISAAESAESSARKVAARVESSTVQAPVEQGLDQEVEASPDDGVAASMSQPVGAASAGGAGGSQGLRSVLENLAERLEARARA